MIAGSIFIVGCLNHEEEIANPVGHVVDGVAEWWQSGHGGNTHRYVATTSADINRAVRQLRLTVSHPARIDPADRGRSDCASEDRKLDYWVADRSTKDRHLLGLREYRQRTRYQTYRPAGLVRHRVPQPGPSAVRLR